ncbi:MAG: hypothetical protein H0U95_12290 [Bacteroidetes bacterium]|nr:hypothetical protein [Bacteroidota bacterium]
METSHVYLKEKHFKKSDTTISAISIGIGLFVSLILMGYFLFIKTYALENIFYLRLLNIFFLLGGIIVAEYFCSSKIAHKVEYLKGIRVGMQVTLAATIPYVIFMALYLKMNPDFISFIRENTNFGKFLTPLPACVAGIVAIEGIVSGFVLTYVIMPYFKRK